MRRGIQLVFNAPVSLEDMEATYAKGFQVARCDVQRAGSPEMVTAILESVLSFGLHPCAIISNPDLQHSIPRGCDIEFGNEANINLEGYWPGGISQYRQGCEAFIALQRALRVDGIQHTVWVGAVANTNEQGFSWLSKLPWSSWPDWVGCCIHTYRDGGRGAEVGHKKVPSWWPKSLGPDNYPGKARYTRDEEYRKVRSLIGPNRHIAVTEFGYSSDEWSEAEQVQHTKYEVDLATRHYIDLLCGYQIHSGPGDLYGYYVDGVWKPMTDALLA